MGCNDTSATKLLIVLVFLYTKVGGRMDSSSSRCNSESARSDSEMMCKMQLNNKLILSKWLNNTSLA